MNLFRRKPKLSQIFYSADSGLNDHIVNVEYDEYIDYVKAYMKKGGRFGAGDFQTEISPILKIESHSVYQDIYGHPTAVPCQVILPKGVSTLDSAFPATRCLPAEPDINHPPFINSYIIKQLQKRKPSLNWLHHIKPESFENMCRTAYNLDGELYYLCVTESEGTLGEALAEIVCKYTTPEHLAEIYKIGCHDETDIEFQTFKKIIGRKLKRHNNLSQAVSDWSPNITP